MKSKVRGPFSSQSLHYPVIDLLGRCASTGKGEGRGEIRGDRWRKQRGGEREKSGVERREV